SREGSGARALISTTRFSITRALLNLISNGFYAATKRKAETNGGDYVPTIGASIKSLGDRVEIKIRDNGTGIPPEVKDKMFNPFFPTKPTGEGTGLGLSISHHIIVKQHGGAIEVDTQPGAFTEIRVILPRVAVFLTESGRSAHLANIQIVPPDVRFEGKVDIASPVVPRQSRSAVLQARGVVRPPPRLGRRAADAPLSSMRIPHVGNP